MGGRAGGCGVGRGGWVGGWQTQNDGQSWAGTFKVYLNSTESQTELGFKSYLPLLTFVNVNNLTALLTQIILMVRYSSRGILCVFVVCG